MLTDARFEDGPPFARFGQSSPATGGPRRPPPAPPLPAWFYVVFMQAQLVAPKPHAGPDPSEVPDVRAGGIRDCWRRTIHRAVIQSHKGVLAQHNLMPLKVAVGVSSKPSRLRYSWAF